MADTSDLVGWLRLQLDEDEAWARAASRAYEYADEGSKPPPDGVHWRWVAGENWDTVTPDPVATEFVAKPGYGCNLATVEEWPSTSRLDDGTVIRVHMMPLTYANDIVEMASAAAGHIIRWDPARVLREVAAKREIVARSALYAYDLLKLLALPYSNRPGFREEWRA
jgi:hypothetical protein